MARILLFLIALSAMASCGPSNPFVVEEEETVTEEEVDPQDPNVDTDANFLFRPEENITMNYVDYDPDADELVINNLPYDGPSGRYVYDRTLSGIPVYASLQTATTGQFQYYAVFIKSEHMEAVSAGGVEWADYGFAGAQVKREEFGLPPNGEYVYLGKYAGIRKRDDRSGLDLVVGDARVLLDILDIDPSGDVQGTVSGTITNRTRTSYTGRAKDPLPSIRMLTTPFETATGVFTEGDVATFKPDRSQRDSGTYTGLIAGPNGEEIGAHIVMTGEAELQEVAFEVVEYEYTLEIDNGLGVVITQTVQGVAQGLNSDNRESIIALVDSGTTVPYLNATPDIPSDATSSRIISSTTDTTILTGDGTAREIGIVSTTQVTP